MGLGTQRGGVGRSGAGHVEDSTHLARNGHIPLARAVAKWPLRPWLADGENPVIGPASATKGTLPTLQMSVGAG